jgi:hypothetical protein
MGPWKPAASTLKATSGDAGSGSFHWVSRDFSVTLKWSKMARFRRCLREPGISV